MATGLALTRILGAATPGPDPLLSLLLGLGLAAPAFADRLPTHLPEHGTTHSASSATPVPTAEGPTHAAKAVPGNSVAVEAAEAAAERGAKVLVAPEYILQNDKLLKAYAIKAAPNATANGVSLPGLLDIAREAQRNQIDAGPDEASSLADAMRHAVWRKKAVAKLESMFSPHGSGCVTALAEIESSTSRSAGLGAAC